jgi:hypothetical protein
MTLKQARALKKGNIIYFGGCSVKYVKLEKGFGGWMVVVNDEKENPKHRDLLTLESLEIELKDTVIKSPEPPNQFIRKSGQAEPITDNPFLKNKKGWMCVFGFHDWEYLKCISKENHKLAFLRNAGHFIGETFPRVYQRICLECKKFEDTMTPHTAEILQERNRKESRHRIAEMLAAKHNSMELT